MKKKNYLNNLNISDDIKVNSNNMLKPILVSLIITAGITLIITAINAIIGYNIGYEIGLTSSQALDAWNKNISTNELNDLLGRITKDTSLIYAKQYIKSPLMIGGTIFLLVPILITLFKNKIFKKVAVGSVEFIKKGENLVGYEKRKPSYLKTIATVKETIELENSDVKNNYLVEIEGKNIIVKNASNTVDALKQAKEVLEKRKDKELSKNIKENIKTLN